MISLFNGIIRKLIFNRFEQRIDHFNLQDQRTYKQKYYVNDEYWKIGNPIFIFIGAEGGISSYWLTNSAMHEYSKEFGAMTVILEHRFYGESNPFNKCETDNLKYLSSRQSLADLASFRDFINKKYNSVYLNFIYSQIVNGLLLVVVMVVLYLHGLD